MPKSFRPPFSNSFESTRSYLENFGFKGLAFTDGANQTLVCFNNADHFIIPQSIICKDSLGAGDVLHGAFCYHYLNSFDFLESLKAAMHIATQSCRYDGPHEWINRI